MFDQQLRHSASPHLAFLARCLHQRSIRPGTLTLVGLVLGLSSAVAAGLSWWWLALVGWLVSRLADGLDGTVARLRGSSQVGGFWDIIADFTVYAAFVGGVAVSRPEARLAAVFLLCAYYVSGASFLAWSSLIHQPNSATRVTSASTGSNTAGSDTAGSDTAIDTTDLALADDRALNFVGGLAEGFETIVVYTLVCLIPSRAEPILWTFAAMVTITAVQRVWFATHSLRSIDNLRLTGSFHSVKSTESVEGAESANTNQGHPYKDVISQEHQSDEEGSTQAG